MAEIADGVENFFHQEWNSLEAYAMQMFWQKEDTIEVGNAISVETEILQA